MKKRVGWTVICLLLFSVVAYAYVYDHILKRYFSKYTKIEPSEDNKCRNVLRMRNLTIGRWEILLEVNEILLEVNETDVKKSATC